MKTYVSAFFALLSGFKLCFSDSKVRSLAIWPWVFGAIGYLISIVIAYYSHGPIVESFTTELSTFWSYALYYFLWLFVAILLVVCSVIVTFSIVMVFGGIYQSAIARHVLELSHIAVPAEEAGVSGTLKEAGRTIFVELTKLLWLIPLLLIVTLIGFIPLFTPIAVLLASWLLAYQFVDVPLDVLKMGVARRLGFALRHPILLTLFGLSLTICWAVPFLGILLPPVAVAGVTKFITHANLLPSGPKNP